MKNKKDIFNYDNSDKTNKSDPPNNAKNFKKMKNSKVNFEIDFYEKLISNNPDFLDALVPLAEAYTKSGNYEQGVKLDERLARLKPEDAVVHYNLACSYSLLLKLDEAFYALKKAIDLGYDDFRFMDQDSDLVNVRNDVRYSEMISDFLKKKGC